MKLIYFILFAFVALLTYTCQNTAQAYQKGDTTPISYICKTEQAMLKLAEIDAYDTDAAGLVMRMYFQEGECIVFIPPGKMAFVAGILLEYQDSKGVLTQVLEVIGDDRRTVYYTIVVVPIKETL